MSRVFFSVFFFVFLLVILISVPVRAAQQDVPAVIQDSMERGLAAVNQEKWDLAIKYFSEAQEAGPAYLPAIFNLALAYDSAGGQELLALCFFYAYLAAAPDAENADAVRARIAALESTIEGNLRKLVKTAEDSIHKLPSEDSPRGAGIKAARMTTLATAAAFAGDVQSAYRITTTINGIKEDAYQDIAAAQAKLGDISGARETVKNVPADKTWAHDFVESRIADSEKEQINLRECDERAQSEEFYGRKNLHFHCYSVDINIPLQDSRVREAIKLATQKERLEKSGDLKKARQLLAEAGHPEGKNFPKLTYLYDDITITRTFAEKIQAALTKNLGLRVEILKYDGDLRAKPWQAIASELLSVANVDESLTEDPKSGAHLYSSLATVDLHKFLEGVKKQDSFAAVDFLIKAVQPMAVAYHKIRVVGDFEEKGK